MNWNLTARVIASLTLSPLDRHDRLAASIALAAAGTVTLQILAQDGSTWLTALTAFAADGYATIDLPPSQYRVALG